MSFATATHRVKSEFVDMPGLELTLPQAVRLWGLGFDDCRFVVDGLVDAGFLRWTERRTIVRAGRDRAPGPVWHPVHVSVPQVSAGDKSVGRI